MTTFNNVHRPRRRATRRDDLLDRRWPSELDTIAIAATRPRARPVPVAPTHGAVNVLSRTWLVVVLAAVAVAVAVAFLVVALPLA